MAKRYASSASNLADLKNLLKIQQDLEASELRYRRLFETAQDGILLLDFETGMILDANKFLVDMLGYSKEQFLKKHLWEVGVFKNIAAYKSIFKTLQNKKNIRFDDLLLKTKSGQKINAEFVANAYKADGESVIQCNIRDITARKHAEEQIVALKNRDEAILTSIGDAVFACDKDGNVLLFNAAAERLTGIPAKKALGYRYDKVITFLKESDEKPIGDFVSEVIKRKEIIRNLNHTLLVATSGKKVPVINSIAPIKQDTGDVIGCVVSFRDVTVERDIDRAKTEFVSLASHQLRTPLTAINWNSEMLLSESTDKLSDRQREYIKQTYKASRRIVELMNALLNVSRLEMGTFIVETKDTDINKLAKECVREIKPQFSHKNISLHEKYDTTLGKIKADAKLVTIIFQNLLSNAFKYTKPGGKIILTIKKGKSEIIISVADTGIGIPKNEQDKIFTKLFRADNARQVDSDGTGLGLYIVKTILDSSGGKISFKSTERLGSTFKVQLPLSGMSKKTGTKGLV
jgi:PAS domain S-box-containing protein